MNKKLQKAALDAKEAERLAERLAEEIRPVAGKNSLPSIARTLHKKTRDVVEDIRQIELDSEIVDVIRAVNESRSDKMK